MEFRNKESKAYLRALFVTTTASMIDQFNRRNIMTLQDMGYEVHIACNLKEGNTIPGEQIRLFCADMEKIGVKVFDLPFDRSPFSYQCNLHVMWLLRKIIKQNHYTIIHCHTPVGGVIARIASMLNIKRWNGRIIYTAHGFHFYDGAPLLNWMLFYPVELELSRVTDVLITINREDYLRAKDKFHAKNVQYVPGIGIDTKKFSSSSLLADERLEERKKFFNVHADSLWLFSVGEINSNKNHRIVIEALSKINNPFIHYFVAGIGNEEDLKKLIFRHHLNNQVHLLGFRKDIDVLMRLMDVYLLPSYREGLNVSLMEAMASGLPCLASDIRGNCDLIVDGKGGYLLDRHNSSVWAVAIERLWKEKNHLEHYGIWNRNYVQEFSSLKIQKRMQEIYLKETQMAGKRVIK